MVHNLVHNLCESLVENIGGIADTGKKTPPTPITYLTQWKMMGNSEVHTDEYLTQWKVEGNSVVDNNAILSCGDYSDVDGKYHVKISNGVSIYDIPLTEPLRKVNDVADSIEFINGVGTLTRNIAATKISDNDWRMGGNTATDNYGFYCNIETKKRNLNIMCAGYNTLDTTFSWTAPDMTIGSSLSVDRVSIKDLRYASIDEFLQGQGDNVILYELATPTTETIQASPFPVSPTDTYTSANVTPYSAFEYKKNVEIWSCGEYSAIDGKYHIVVLPEGKSPVDIALDEPLRKVDDVADIIEFADGVATLTRNFASTIMSDMRWSPVNISSTDKYRYFSASVKDKMKIFLNNQLAVMLCPIYDVHFASPIYNGTEIGIAANSNGIYLYDDNYDSVDDLTAFLAHINGAELIYALATPTTEVIQVPQIQEAESYSCVISQGAKAVEWSSFETD